MASAQPREAFEAAASVERSRPGAEEERLLERMHDWAQRGADTEDARTTRLLDWMQEDVSHDERVIVFSEYRATQRYLHRRAEQGAGDGTRSA